MKRRAEPALPVCLQGQEAFCAEDGYILITVIFFALLLLLSLAVAAPRIAKSIQRDRELEAIQRGLQYKRAIQLYYKKFGNFPTSIEQLVQSNNIRFLRRRYLDPITGKDDWKLMHMGQAHVRPYGFFGQPFSAPNTTSIAGATPVASTSSGFGGSSGIGGGSGFGGSSGSGFGDSSSSGTGTGASTSSGSSGLFVGMAQLYAPDASTSSSSSTGDTSGFGSSSTSGELQRLWRFGLGLWIKLRVRRQQQRVWLLQLRLGRRQFRFWIWRQQFRLWLRRRLRFWIWRQL